MLHIAALRLIWAASEYAASPLPLLPPSPPILRLNEPKAGLMNALSEIVALSCQMVGCVFVS